MSEALILAAFDVGRLGDYKDIAVYRNNRFVEKWKALNFKGNPDNWTPQVRTELNQKSASGEPSRLAGRMFEGGSGKYRLRDKSGLSKSDAVLYDQLYKLYLYLTSDHKTIVQENIILHNDTHCLSTGTGSKCSCATCPYKVHEKYKCSKLYDKNTGSYLVPPQIPIPLNVFTVGTVNVDETTHMFSPKILDRSNVIEFNEVDFAGIYKLSPAQISQINSVARSVIDNNFYFSAGKPVPDFSITIPCSQSVNSFSSKAPTQFDDLISIFTILKKYNLHFGYRVMNEISQYMINVFEYTDYSNCATVALDNQILQKILPKIYGAFDKIWSPLTEILGVFFITPLTINTIDVQELIQILDNNSNGMIGSLDLNASTASSYFKYPKAAMKIMTMLKDLDDTGFATYIK